MKIYIKKIFAVICAIGLVAGLSSCKNDADDKKKDNAVGSAQWLPSLPKAAETIDIIGRDPENTADGELSARSLQGLINKTEPRVYIEDSWVREGVDVEKLRQNIISTYGECKLNRVDYTKSQKTDRTFWTIFEKYKDEVKKLYIYDSSMPDSINVAVMLAGRNEGIAVSPQMAEALSSYGLPSENVVEKYKFTDHIQINKWIRDNMVKDSNTQAVFVLCPTGRDENSKILPQSYDLAVATDALIYHFYPYLESEVKLHKEILDQFPADTLVIGWAGADVESDYVKAVSSAGKSVVCTDWGYPNGSVWGAFESFRTDEKKAEIPKTYDVDSNTTYVAFCVSDGDAWHYASRDMLSFWNQEVRSSVPIGWTVPSLFAEASPLIMRYLYNTKSDNDEFIQGPSGYGYVYAGNMPEKSYSSYLSKSKTALQSMGLNMVNYWDISTGNNAMVGNDITLVQKYAKTVQPDAVFLGHDGSGTWQMIGDTVVMQEVGDLNGAGTKSASDIVSAVKRVKAKTKSGDPAFVMVNVEAWGYGVSSINAAVAALEESGGSYKFVKPSELVAAVRSFSKSGAKTSDAPKAEIPVNTVTFVADSGENEKKWLFDDSNSGLFNEEKRFADGAAFWSYAIDVTDTAKYPRLELELGGQYKISYSYDGELWTVLKSSIGTESEGEVYVDLRNVIKPGVKKLYIRFGDAVPTDGFGAVLTRFSYIG